MCYKKELFGMSVCLFLIFFIFDLFCIFDFIKFLINESVSSHELNELKTKNMDIPATGKAHKLCSSTAFPVGL